MPRWLTISLVAACLIGVAAFAFWAVVLQPFTKREADAKAAFGPLVHLDPLILDNGFGVYHVEFNSESKLADGNVAELLTLNQLPAEYDLTLWLRTPAITDASVPVLSQLTTTDTIVIDGAGLTENGIAQLALAKPNVFLCSADGTALAPQLLVVHVIGAG